MPVGHPWSFSAIPTEDSAGCGGPSEPMKTRAMMWEATVTRTACLPRAAEACRDMATGHMPQPWFNKQPQKWSFYLWAAGRAQHGKPPPRQAQVTRNNWAHLQFFKKTALKNAVVCFGFWLFSQFGFSEITNISHLALFLAQNEHKINGKCLSLLVFKVWISPEDQLDHIHLKGSPKWHGLCQGKKQPNLQRIFIRIYLIQTNDNFQEARS